MTLWRNENIPERMIHKNIPWKEKHTHTQERNLRIYTRSLEARSQNNQPPTINTKNMQVQLFSTRVISNPNFTASFTTATNRRPCLKHRLRLRRHCRWPNKRLPAFRVTYVGIYTRIIYFLNSLPPPPTWCNRWLVYYTTLVCVWVDPPSLS